MLLEKAMKRLERADALDEPAEKLVKVVGPATRPRVVKNALSGTWLGHRFHPLLVPLPIGFWTGALLFDLVATRRARWAADTLVGAGIAAAVPTAAAGLSDWADAEPDGRRVGLVHASCNTLALLCYSSSLVARLLGARKAGVGLGLAGAAAMSAGGYLGGHLSYVQAVGVEKKRFAGGPSSWTPVLDEAELEDGRPRVVRAGDTEVLLVPRGQPPPRPVGQLHPRVRPPGRGPLRRRQRDLPLARQHLPPGRRQGGPRPRRRLPAGLRDQGHRRRQDRGPRRPLTRVA